MSAAAELKEWMLREPRWTVAAAESLTAGNVQARIATVSGASNYFLGGITAYTLEQKVRHLGVDRATAEKVDCVSAEVAEQMARGVCGLFGADWGVATTGYAEPAKERGIAAPFAWWAVARRGESGEIRIRHGRVECPGASRVEAQAIVAEAVLGELAAWAGEARSGTVSSRR